MKHRVKANTIFVVVAYDIPKTKRRTKVMKMLEGYGEHVQESVFECDLKEGVYHQMVTRLRDLVNLEQDNICLYHLSLRDKRRIEHWGVSRAVQMITDFKIV
jgi:CRISPR-associated protein Cas2